MSLLDYSGTCASFHLAHIVPYGSEGPMEANARYLLDALLMLLHAFIAQAKLHLISNVPRSNECESRGLGLIYLSVD